MRIEIVSIDREDVVWVGPNASLGYRGRLRCSLVSGEAVFVPYTERDNGVVVGSSISLETGQESVSDFLIVPPDVEPTIDAQA